LADSLKGKTVRCKKCQTMFVVSAKRSSTTKSARPSGSKASGQDEDILPARATDDEAKRKPRWANETDDNPAPAQNMLPWILGGGAALVVMILGVAGITAVAMRGGREKTAEQPAAAQTPETDNKLLDEARPNGIAEANESGAANKPLPEKSQPEGSRGQLAPAVLNALKDATVFIKVEAGSLSSSGSGFLVRVDGNTGFIVTNRHVVNPEAQLLAPSKDRRDGPLVKPVPKNAVCTAVFNSGTKEERAVPAEILVTDTDRDLAVLQVKDVAQLPKPIDLRDKLDLVETMPVFSLGFPFGEALSKTQGNPAITIQKGSIASLRETDFGPMKAVQIDGAINLGNSGGPVVDNQGRLVGMSLATMRKTGNGVAIASEELTGLFHGRISGLSFRVIKADRYTADVAVELSLMDPLNRIQSAFLRYDVTSLPAVPLKQHEDGTIDAMPGGKRLDMPIEGQKAEAMIQVRLENKDWFLINHQTAFVDSAGVTHYAQVTNSRVIVDKIVVGTVPPPPPKINQPQPPGLPNQAPQPGGLAPTLPLTNYPGPTQTGTHPQMTHVAKVSAFLSFVVDGANKSALFFLPDGEVKHYSYPEFAHRASYHIDGAVTQAALDARRGLVYAAVAPVNKVPTPGSRQRVRGQCNLYIYDVKALIQGKLERKAELEPQAAIPLEAVVADMYLSADGKWLYYLDVHEPSDAKLVRIDTAAKNRDREVQLADGVEILRMTPDGKKFVAGTSAASNPSSPGAGAGKQFDVQLQIVDAGTLKIEKSIGVKDPFYDMDLSITGHAFLTGMGQPAHVMGINLVTGKQTASWAAIYGGAFIRVSNNGKRLYLCNQWVSPKSIECWGIPKDFRMEPVRRLGPREGGDRTGAEIQLTPDGKYLLCKTGMVFELAGAVARGK
jgi:S1-C subfamily serine protease